MKSIVIVLLGSVSFFFLHFNKQKVEEYPTIVWKMAVHNIYTKSNIDNVHCTTEIYYEHVHCQPSLAPIFLIERYNKILNTNKHNLTNTDIERMKSELIDLKKELIIAKEQNNIPKLDTFIYGSPFIDPHMNPFKKYTITLTHPDYQTLRLSRDFDVCKFSVNINAGMIPKTKN